MTSRSAPRVEHLCGARRVCALGLLAAIASSSRAPAQPQEPPLELRWQAPPGCPERGTVLERIRKLTGSSVRRDNRLEADGTITRTGRQFRLRLVLRAGDLAGERELESDSCDALAGAAAVALGLLLSSAEPLSERDLSGTPLPDSGGSSDDAPDATLEPPAPEPAATAPSPAEPPAPTPPASEGELEPLETDEHASWPVHALLQAPMGTVDFGPLPGPSFGVAGALGLRVGAWQALMLGQWIAPQVFDAPDFPGAGVEVRRLTAEAWFCHGFRLAQVELSPCALAALDRVRVLGHGRYVQSRSDLLLRFSGGAGVIARWHVFDFLAVVLEAGARFGASGPQLELEGIGNVRRVGPGTVTMKVGPEWIL